MSNVVLRRLFPVWALMLAAVVVLGAAVFAYAEHQNARRDEDLRSAQLAGCKRLRDTVIAYNRQYQIVFGPIIPYARAHPGDELSQVIIRGFTRKDFPVVKPPRCSRIRIY